MTRIPVVMDGTLQVAAAGKSAGVVVGSPAWFAWLSDDSAPSFSFRTPAGNYTARKERRRRLLGGLPYGCGSPVQEVLGHVR